MPALFLKCHVCDQEFASGITVNDDATMRGVAMFGLVHDCPVCGARGQYFTPEYYAPSPYYEHARAAERVNHAASRACARETSDAIPD